MISIKATKFLKVIFAMLLLSVCMGNTSISAKEDETKKVATKYTSDQMLVLDEKTDTYLVVDADQVVMPRYTTTKTLHFNAIKVDVSIYVNNNTGKIYSTGIKKSNNNYIVLYDVNFNSNETIAYFTITVYSKDIFGNLNNALETKYLTIYSGGPI